MGRLIAQYRSRICQSPPGLTSASEQRPILNSRWPMNWLDGTPAYIGSPRAFDRVLGLPRKATSRSSMELKGSISELCSRPLLTQFPAPGSRTP
jgi:hypothetical protein